MNHRATLFLALAAVGLAMCNAQAACTFYKPLNGTETKCWPSTEQVPARAPAASPWPLLPLPAGCPAPLASPLCFAPSQIDKMAPATRNATEQ
jgi:hypothetical protein